MKNYIFIFLFALVVPLVHLSAQNPYAQFGCKVTELTANIDTTYQIIYNSDLTAEIHKIGFDYKNQKVDFYGIDNKIVKILFISPDIFLHWISPDPKEKNYPGWSPYNFVEGNPIKNIDPDGMGANDWIKDKTGQIEFDPTVNKASDVKPGQTYIGKQFTMNTGRGTAQFRKDGSILVSNQTDAYNRIWNNDLHTGREQLGTILNDSKVLVAPDYKNGWDENTTEDYGYTWKNGNIYDPVIGGFQSVLATIHAHTGPASIGVIGRPSPDDIGYYTARTPNKLFLTLGQPYMQTYADVGTSYENYTEVPQKLLPTVTQVLNGYDLISRIKYIQSGLTY